MLKASFLNWILLTFLIAFLTACSGGGDSSSSSDTAAGRSSDIETPFWVLEGASGDVTALDLSFIAEVSGLIDYETFNITAAEKSDYVPLSGQLTVIQGEEYTISIDVYGDDRIEGSEIFGVKLTQGDTEFDSLIGRIINDDLPELTVSTPQVTEGDFGTTRMTFELSLSESVVDEYVLSVSTVQDGLLHAESNSSERYATPELDFEPFEGDFVFSDGLQTLSFSIEIINENILELDEYVRLEVKNSEGVNALTNGNDWLLGLIISDEAPDNEGFDLTISSNNQVEGTADPEVESSLENDWTVVEYEVTVQSSENILETQSVQFVLVGDESDAVESFTRATFNADAGLSDYCASNPVEAEGVCDNTGVISLDPDTASFTFSFYVRADSDIEPDEFIEIVLNNDQGIEFATTYHTIRNDDAPALQITYEGDSGSVTQDLETFIAEGRSISVTEEGGDQSVNISLASELTYEWSIPYNFDRVSGSNIGSSDYNSASGTMVFPAGSTTPNTLPTVTIYPDGVYEGDEAFALFFGVGGIDSLPMQIIDNDLPKLNLTNSNNENLNELSESSNDNIFGSLFEYVQINESDAAIEYTLILDDGTSALSDLYIYYQIEALGTPDKSGGFCSYLADSADVKQHEAGISDDFNFYFNGVKTDPDSIVLYGIDSTKMDVQLEVVNDALVECLEYFSITFYIANTDTIVAETPTESVTHNFEIGNLDRAQLTVTGWELAENNATGIQTYSVEVDQPVVLSLIGSIADSGEECNVDYNYAGVRASMNGDAAYSGASSIWTTNTVDENYLASVNGVDRNYDFEVTVKDDSLVEPDESCQFSITPSNNDVVDITYCDDQGACSSILSAAEGAINDNDAATIQITEFGLTDISKLGNGEAACTVDQVEDCFLEYKVVSDLEIASNYPAISVQLADVENQSGVTSEYTNDYQIYVTDADSLVALDSNITLKAAGSVFNDDYYTKVSIIDDSLLELDEAIQVQLTLVDGASHPRVSISGTNHSIQHTIPQNEELEVRLILQETTQPIIGEVLVENSAFSDNSGAPIAVTTNVDIAKEVGDLNLVITRLDCDTEPCADDNDFTIAPSNNLTLHEGPDGQVSNDSNLLSSATYAGLTLFNDDLLEVDEGIKFLVQLDKSSDIPVQFIKNSELTALTVPDGYANSASVDYASLTSTLYSEEVLTLELTKNVSGDSADEGDLTVQDDPLTPDDESERDTTAVLYSLSLDTPIASNYPSITLSLGSNSESGNSAAQENNDYTLTYDDIHTNDNGNTASGDQALTLTILGDDTLEPIEALTHALSINNGHTGYVSFAAASGDILGTEFSYSILNDDDLAITLTKDQASLVSVEGDLTVQDDPLTPAVDESVRAEAEVTYTLALSNSIASNYPTISLSTGSNTESGDTTATEDSDYTLSFSNIHTENGGDTESDDQVLTLTILGDDTLEPTETLAHSFIVTNGASHPDVSLSGDSLSYTIANDEVLTISLTKDVSGTASSEGNLVTADDPLTPDTDETVYGSTAIGYTLGLSNPIASNYPTISLSSGSNTETGNNVAQESIDYTLSYTDIHTLNGGDTSSDDQDLTLTLLGDNTLEPSETLAHTFALNSGHGSNVVIEAENVGLGVLGNEISYTINNDDALVITLSKDVAGTSSSEGALNTTTNIAYTLSLDNPVASNFETIALSLAANSDSSSSAATEDSDYSISFNNIHTLNGGDTPNGNQALTLTLIGDNTLEQSEGLSHTLSLVGSPSGVSLSASPIAYTINNDDYVKVTVAPQSAVSISETGSGSGATQNTGSDTYTYSVSTDFPIAANYTTSMPLTLGYASNCQAAKCATEGGSNDYTITDNDTGNTSGITLYNGTDLSSAGNKGTISLTVNRDDLVEWNETVQYDLSVGAGHSFVSVEFNGSGSTLGHTITNDDFIDVTLSSNTTLTESNGVTSVTATVSDYSTGFSEGSISLPINLNSSDATFNTTGASADVTGVQTSIDVVSTKNSSPTLLSVSNDNTIEPNEAFEIAISSTSNEPVDYSQLLNISSAVTYTIEDDDKFIVTLPLFLDEDDGADTPSNTEYIVQLCYDSANNNEVSDGLDPPTLTNHPLIEGNTSTVIYATLGTLTSPTGELDILTPNLAVGGDVQGSLDERDVSFDLTVAFTLNSGQYCLEEKLFELKADTAIEGTEWLSINPSASLADTRLSGDELSGYEFPIGDNDYPFFTNTGATKCLQSDGALTDAGATACTSLDVNSTEWSSYPEQSYVVLANGMNDSVGGLMTIDEPTPVWPDGLQSLNFSTADNNGDAGYCLFDNYTANTWLIGGYSASQGNSTSYVAHKPLAISAIALPTTWCGATNIAGADPKSWTLPDVQDLLSILHIEKLRAATLINGVNDGDTSFASASGYLQNSLIRTDVAENADPDLNSCADGDPTCTTTISSRYWSSEVCTVSTADDGQWVLDFASAQLSCILKTDTALVRPVYK